MLEDRTKSLAAVQAKELAKERKKAKRYAAFSAGILTHLNSSEERKRSESFEEELESLRPRWILAKCVVNWMQNYLNKTETETFPGKEEMEQPRNGFEGNTKRKAMASQEDNRLSNDQANPEVKGNN
ncbi:Uncharacterized protein Rs2_34994 [Raphanus sativus]|nr:Uncharacterized protein Rs2_34994 [Raphanus sativus]